MCKVGEWVAGRDSTNVNPSNFLNYTLNEVCDSEVWQQCQETRPAAQFPFRLQPCSANSQLGRRIRVNSQREWYIACCFSLV